MNQTSANAYCQANGMQLNVVLDDLDYDLLEVLSGKAFPGSGLVFLVNGIQSANGTFYAYNPNPQLIYSGVKLTSGSGCLALEVNSGPRISFKGVACTTAMNFICEFY